MGGRLCVSTEVSHAGTLLVCPWADGPPKEARVGRVVGGRSAGKRSRSLPATGTLSVFTLPVASARPSAALFKPQGAGLLGPAASSNWSYASCYRSLCEERLDSRTTHKILFILGKIRPVSATISGGDTCGWSRGK